MSDELFFTRQAHEVVADHLEGSLGRLASGPQVDQKARDDRAVTLDHDSVLRVADQMRAAKELFEKSKKDLNDPSLGIDQCDDLGGDIE